MPKAIQYVTKKEFEAYKKEVNKMIKELKKKDTAKVKKIAMKKPAKKLYRI